MELLKDILSSTAWQMEIPPAYGVFHISFVLIGFFVSFSAAFLLRKLSDKANNILIFSIGAFLLVAEIYKQLMYKLIIDPDALYHWGAFPFHLCSVPMYLCLIIPFLKKGRVQQTMYDFLMTYNLLGGFISFFEPSGLLHSYVMTTAHSLIWHMTLVFLGAYVGFSRRGGIEKRNYKQATILFLVLCVVAFAINCAFWEVSGGELNNFFVGPKISSLIVFNQIGEMFGWYTCTAVYIPAVCLGAGIIFTVIRLIATHPYKRKAKTV